MTDITRFPCPDTLSESCAYPSFADAQDAVSGVHPRPAIYTGTPISEQVAAHIVRLSRQRQELMLSQERVERRLVDMIERIEKALKAI